MDLREAASQAAHNTGVITYSAAGGAVLFGVSAAELAAYIGAAVAILTFVANQYWQYRSYKLKEHQHEHEQHGCKECK